MDIFVYSDESGTFDSAHNKWFAFGGLIFFSKEEKDNFSRKYLAAEKAIRQNGYASDDELKACRISNKEKGKLYRSTNQCVRFGVIIDEELLHPQIFQSKKDKQRYMDFAYKLSLKNAFQNLIAGNVINPDEVCSLHIFNDEHTTATNGHYELKEGLEQEFKSGTFNRTYDIYYPPIFSNLGGIDLHYCNSEKITLIRAADIIANRIYYMAKEQRLDDLKGIQLLRLPSQSWQAGE